MDKWALMMQIQELSLIIVVAGLQVDIITSFIGLSARFNFFVHHFSFEPKIAQNLKWILTVLTFICFHGFIWGNFKFIYCLFLTEINHRDVAYAYFEKEH